MSYPYHDDHPNATGTDIVPSTPEVPEIQQEDPTLDIKGTVTVANSVRVLTLPSRHGVSSSLTLTEGRPLALLGANQRRSRVVLIGMAPSGSTSLGFYVGPLDAVQAEYSAIWPYNVPLILKNTEQVYAMPEGTGLAAGHIISVIAEDWAD